MKSLLLSPVYALLMWIKIFPGVSFVNEWIVQTAKLRNFKLLSLENSYRVQIFIETFAESIPMLVVLVTQQTSPKENFSAIGIISIILSVLLILKNGTMIVLFVSNRAFEQIDSAMRPIKGADV